MNIEEITISTLGSNSTFTEPKEETNLQNKTISTLLKLVYKDKKSIKQASKYLNINYNCAKKIVKNFRKNQLPFNEEANSIVEEIIIDKEAANRNTLLNHFKYYDVVLSKLNEEIKFNNSMIMVGLQLTRMCNKV